MGREEFGMNPTHTVLLPLSIYNLPEVFSLAADMFWCSVGDSMEQKA